MQSGSLSQSKLERLIVFAVVVSGIATGYVFYHTVGIFGFDALFGQHVYKRRGRRVAEYPFHGVCTVGVFPIPFVIAVLCQIAEPVLAFAVDYRAEAVIVGVIPCFALQQPIIAFFNLLFIQFRHPTALLGAVVGCTDIVISRLTVVDHVRQHRDVDGRVLCVVFRFVLVFVYTGKQTYHDDRQHQNACQYFENFAFHFGSPFFTDTSRA